GDLLGLIERLIEHHGSQRGKRDAATTAALVTLRRTGSPHRREQQDSIVENEINAGLLQPARLEAGVVGNDATTAEKIGQYNQRARRDGTVEDHHGGALAVGELHGAHAVGGRRRPVVSTSRERKRSRGKRSSRLSSVTGTSPSRAGRPKR